MNKKVFIFSDNKSTREYLLRVLGYIFIVPVIAVGIYIGSFSYTLLWLIPYSLIYPHLVQLITLKFQHRNPIVFYKLRMMLDALHTGAIAAFIGFALIPSLLGFIVIVFSALMIGGIRLMLPIFIAAVAAAGLGWLIFQPIIMLETHLLVAVLSVLLAGLFICLTAYYVHFRSIYLDKVQCGIQREQEKLIGLTQDVAKYLSPQIRETILSGKRTVKLETRREKITIFFSDIKDFTILAEEMEAEALTDLLNHYLNEMSNIAIKHGGTIDKFIGDSIMIFFGDPTTGGVKKDAQAALSMAIEMREKLKVLRQHWHTQGIDGLLEVRMGINTGYCTVGNFGADTRMEYTIIGREVNLASRLESAADVGEILISNETYSLTKDFIMATDHGEITVKGFSRPVQTFQVVDLHSNIGFKSSYIEHETPGFSMYLDTNNIKKQDKEQVIYALKDAAERLRHKKLM
ncbi:MAG TPA: adenylate/guanylate cyclase domain-containing protein [Thiopseudomonas sp.]|nr:adenylate/guanylate cyclase domain-containing protein [Thiopseudomonas sp.]